jgi:thiol-disulfide isomerase/thioredoxin
MSPIKKPSLRSLATGLIISMLITVQAQGGEWLEELDLSQYQEKVVYIDFWASWCGPCRESFPWINAINDKYKDKGLIVIGVNVDAERESAELFLKTNPANFNLLADPTGMLAEKYALLGMPSSFVIDGKGVVRERHVGFKKSNVQQYEDGIVTLLNELKSNQTRLVQE